MHSQQGGEIPPKGEKFGSGVKKILLFMYKTQIYIQHTDSMSVIFKCLRGEGNG